MRDVFYNIAAVVAVRKPDTIFYNIAAVVAVRKPDTIVYYAIEHMIRASSPTDNIVIVGDVWED